MLVQVVLYSNQSAINFLDIVSVEEENNSTTNPTLATIICMEFSARVHNADGEIISHLLVSHLWLLV